MSLYGALFGGVAGLNAQSSKIGVISDNIANVNTIGYKQGETTFSTLVVNASSSVSYQTGGVRAGTRLDIDKQGTLQSTESSTDLAISGGGLFIVKSVPNAKTGDTQNTPLYTRAGSFTQDSLGNYINANGFYLQGWPLDREGRLPGEPGNLNTTSFNNFDSLQTVNVQSASGVAQATTTVALGANLNSGEVVFAGEAGTLTPDTNNSVNQNQPASSILAGAEYGMATADSLHRGDEFSISTGSGLQYTYEYGGYTVGRDVNTVGGAGNTGDGGTNNTTLTSLAGAGSFIYNGGTTYIVHVPGNGLIDGDKITLSGFAAIGATPASELNGTHVVTRLNANDLLITVNTAPGGAHFVGEDDSAAGEKVSLRQYIGNILDAASTTQTFLNQLGTGGFTTGALSFTVTTPTSGTKTYTYTNATPNTLNGQFNNMQTLADAINSTTGLSARVVNGRLMVSGATASDSVTFANGDNVGTATKRGIDWVGELDLQNVGSGTRRFNSLQSLADIVNTDTGVSAKVSNPLAAASLSINVDDPLSTIQFKDLPQAPFSVPTVGTPIAVPAGTFVKGASIDVVINDPAPPAAVTVGSSVYISGLASGTGGLPANLPNGGPYVVTAVTGSSYTVRLIAPQTVTLAGGNYAAPASNEVSIAGISNQGSLLSSFGLTPSLGGAAYVPQATAVLGPKYDPTGQVGDNMASGKITAQFSRNVRVYDSLGTGHDITFSFLKTATNTWAVEVHVTPTSDVNTTLVNGQVATGNISFNGDGSLRSLSAALTQPLKINWTNGSATSTVALNLGTAGEPFGTVGATTIGETDGLSQFDSSYNVNFANQNGAPVGQLVSVAINNQGVVVASYSNGQTQDLYKLPLASFANPDGLNALSGNVYSQTADSGEANLREAGTNGTGKIQSGSLEQSNVDLATQLTDMIVAQRSYQANTKVIKTADDLLNDLNQI